jgi:hypothetical protein
MPRSFWACDQATAGYYPHDPEHAKKLVAEAGHQELIVSQLAHAGIHISLVPAAAPNIKSPIESGW